MKKIFVNLKRFEVARSFGGVCDVDLPDQWIANIMEECIELGLGVLQDVQVNFLLPEALIIPAVHKLKEFPSDKTASLSVGCQGVHRDDIKIGGNFGAFTSTFPATAAKMIGCTWAMIGHSEERKNIQEILEIGGAGCNSSNSLLANQLLSKEVDCAFQAGLNVLYCIGETAEERGSGSFEEQKSRIKDVLRNQIEVGLNGSDKTLNTNNVVIGYEPIWAIGPGKVPPDAKYIDFVSSYIKETMHSLYDMDVTVVYGGGLKEENAKEIGGVRHVGGGLIALTRFTGNIGFYPNDLKIIINKYLQQ